MTKYIIKVPCPTCLGTGYWRRKPELKLCDRCDGTGEVERTVNVIISEETTVQP